jgi:putative membrane protein
VSERDYSEPAELIDTGENAVDRFPSDADVAYRRDDADEEETDADVEGSERGTSDGEPDAGAESDSERGESDPGDAERSDANDAERSDADREGDEPADDGGR